MAMPGVVMLDRSDFVSKLPGLIDTIWSA